MDNSTEYIQYLWERYITDKASKAEVQQLFNYIRNPANDLESQLITQEIVKAYSSNLAADPIVASAVWQNVLDAREANAGDPQDKNVAGPVHRIHFLRRGSFRYAAAILIIFGLGAAAYLWTKNKKVEAVVAIQTYKDIAPGGERAVLTLSDGSSITLDSAANGAIAEQGNAAIVKLADGQIAYKVNGRSKGGEMMNTMHTPKGGQYQLTLPDGTKVWLNAASSIHYPTVFAGKERKVAITGEAYFEIAKNESMPFTVTANGVTMQVLGTSFNVNAYDDEEKVNTTLLEGAVKVVGDVASALLKPGEQAQFTKAGDVKLVHHADVEEAIAWKIGLFQLKNADIPTVMRQVARWYDVEIVYEEGFPRRHISGKVPRDAALSQVLRVFELMGVHFRIEGKKITVMKETNKP